MVATATASRRRRDGSWMRKPRPSDASVSEAEVECLDLDIWMKAAALLQSVVKNHPLIDGNKRLGWLSTAVFLDLNGVATQHATDDDV
jgi:prophage maintenance system killer protein